MIESAEQVAHLPDVDGVRLFHAPVSRRSSRRYSWMLVLIVKPVLAVDDSMWYAVAAPQLYCWVCAYDYSGAQLRIDRVALKVWVDRGDCLGIDD